MCRGGGAGPAAAGPIIMPRRSQEAYGNRVVSHYAEGGATEVYCNRAVCPSVILSYQAESRRSLKTKR